MTCPVCLTQSRPCTLLPVPGSPGRTFPATCMPLSKPSSTTPWSPTIPRPVDSRPAPLTASSRQPDDGPSSRQLARRRTRTPNIHRSEAAIAARLPATDLAPQLLGSFDDGEWVALVLQDVDGRHPVTPWDATELDRVLGSLSVLTTSLTPSPISDLPRAEQSQADDFAGWARIAADNPDDLDPWATDRLDALAASAEHGLRSLHGESLVHTDLRADNLLIRSDGTVAFVDWPWACIGAAWLDAALLLVNVNAFGGHDMEALVQDHLRGVPAEAVTGVLAGLAGYFLDKGRQPAQPGLPTVRAFPATPGRHRARLAQATDALATRNSPCIQIWSNDTLGAGSHAERPHLPPRVNPATAGIRAHPEPGNQIRARAAEADQREGALGVVREAQGRPWQPTRTQSCCQGSDRRAQVLKAVGSPRRRSS